MRSVLPLVLVFFSGVAAAGDSAPAAPWTRPAFVDSVTPLPDGAKDIVVSGGLQAPDGSVQTVHLGELLKQAARAECGGGDYDLKADDRVRMNDGGADGLRFTLKGTVRCKLGTNAGTGATHP